MTDRIDAEYEDLTNAVTEAGSTDAVFEAFDAGKGLDGFGDLLVEVGDLTAKGQYVLDRAEFEDMLIDLKAIRQALVTVHRRSA